MSGKTGIIISEMATEKLPYRTGNGPWIVLVAGWLVPGLGHFLLKKPARAALLFAAIMVLIVMGLLMGGKIYMANTGDLLDVLGFVANMGTPLVWLAALTAHLGLQPVFAAVAEWGTKFIVIAGLLNVMAAVDAHSIANGRKADR